MRMDAQQLDMTMSLDASEIIDAAAASLLDEGEKLARGMVSDTEAADWLRQIVEHGHFLSVAYRDSINAYVPCIR